MGPFMSTRSFASLLSAAVAIALSTSAFAQTDARVVAPVDDRLRIPLAGSIPQLAQAEFDQGEAPAAAEMVHVKLLFQRTPEQEAALDALLNSQRDKGSPNYRAWVSPEEFGRRFGPGDADIAAITSWLEDQGLTRIAVPAGRTHIEFSGTVDVLERVFHTPIHDFLTPEREFLANTKNPEIPAAFSTVISGITGLNTIHADSSVVEGPRGRINTRSDRLERVQGAAGASPDLTGGSSSFPFLYITAADGATIYNMPNSFNANFPAGSTSYTGTGVTIGIAGEATIQPATVVNYRTLFVGDQKAPTATYFDQPSSASTLTEAYLDLDVAGGMAPGASLQYYGAQDVLDAADAAINANKVDILNVSFGICELNASTENQLVSSYWQQAVAQGIAVTVATGDKGSASCDRPGSAQASNGLAVNSYGSTPYNVAVGGTDSWGLVEDFSKYVSPEASGTSANHYRTALSYVPESTWNDSQTTPGPIATALIENKIVEGGGGGPSTCAIQNTDGLCVSGYKKPVWQEGLGVPADGVRNVPDVSLMAGVGFDDADWVICTDDGSCTGTQFFIDSVGGTSASAPAFAGILAMVQQKEGARLGQAAAELYTLFNSTYRTEVFNDITLGNNAPPCVTPTTTVTSPDCVENTVGKYLLSGYNSGTGFDLATGMGSVNATNLEQYWGKVVLKTATVTVTPAVVSFWRGSTLSVAVSVSGTGATPVGNVTLSGGGYTSAPATIINGSATIIIPADVLTDGADTLTANYSGDAIFHTGSGTASVTVTQLTPTITVVPAESQRYSAYSLNVTVTLTATQGVPTGTVVISGGGYTSSPLTLSNGSATVNIPANTFKPGTVTLTATYAQTANYAAVSAQSSVSIILEPSTVKVAPTVSSNWRGSTLPVAITVTGGSGAPSGTVTLSGGGYTSAATTLASGTATITVPPDALADGTDVLTASYSGNSTLNPSTGTASVTVTRLTPTVTTTPSSTQALRSNSLTVAVALTAAQGVPTGTVILSGGGYTSPATALSDGKASIVVPANSLSPGTVTLTATYVQTSDFAAATAQAKVVVTETPSVVVTPASTSVLESATLSVKVTVTAPVGTPTGTVTLTSKGYTSAVTTLSAGAATIIVPANTLAVGSTTINATYSGDTNDTTATGAATVTVSN